jgi:hypothetical protein
VTHLDDGVPDSISSLTVLSRAHTPKTFPCAFMHIHLFRGSLLKIKIGDTRPWVYDTRTCNCFEHENQSNPSGVVTTVSPIPSSREGIHDSTYDRHDVSNGSKEALEPLLPLRHRSKP